MGPCGWVNKEERLPVGAAFEEEDDDKAAAAEGEEEEESGALRTIWRGL